MLERDLELEVKTTIKRNDTGKFVVSWPWKPQARKNLALNLVISETRLRRMVKRMTPKEYAAYDNLLQEGHVEHLPRKCNLIFHTEALLNWIGRQLSYA